LGETRLALTEGHDLLCQSGLLLLHWSRCVDSVGKNLLLLHRRGTAPALLETTAPARFGEKNRYSTVGETTAIAPTEENPTLPCGERDNMRFLRRKAPRLFLPWRKKQGLLPWKTTANAPLEKTANAPLETTADSPLKQTAFAPLETTAMAP
jgi:hypothetical protein